MDCLLLAGILALGAAGTAALSVRARAYPEGKVPLQLLPDGTGRPTCLDGVTAPGYYFSAASGSHGGTWVLLLQGGGECANVEECHGKLGTGLSSSDKMPGFLDDAVSMPKLVSGDPAENPRFHAANRVFLPYCSQDLWTGRNGTLQLGKQLLRFQGFSILRAILDDLDARHGLRSTAREILLSGESAGALGVINSVDYVAERYPAAQVVGLPIAGFWLAAHPYAGPGHTATMFSDFREGAFPQHFALWDSAASARCAAAPASSDRPATWACIVSNVASRYLQTATFFVVAQTDSVMMTKHNWVPEDGVIKQSPPVMAYAGEFKENVTRELHQLDAHHGFFSPACFTHLGFSAVHGPFIGDPAANASLSYMHAFLQWYDGAAVRLEDHKPLLGGDCWRF